MKSLLYIALVLSALMIVASVDTVPDPPAVNSHGFDLKLGGLLEVPDASAGQRVDRILSWPSLLLPVRRIDFIEIVTLSPSSRQITRVSAAGDPSPPVLL
ncbi:MAG: hypothetical protein ABI833_19425 [Acidobacteriota bacterium]